MKKIIKIFVFILLSVFVINVKAVVAPTFIEKWENNHAYYKGEMITDEWAYDSTTKKYILFDENGNKIKELDNLENDPSLKKGKVEISADVPDGLKDIKISFTISSDSYFYTIELNKENNFKVEKEVNADLYTVELYTVTGYEELDNQLPKQFKIYEGQTTSYKIDYSKHKTKNTKDTKVKKIIIIVAVTGIVIAFIIILLMFLKARSI